MMAIIGGTGIYQIVERGEVIETKRVETPYGSSPEISIFQLEDRTAAFMPRHAQGHVNPPHMINYQANIYALKQIGVDRIIATNAVGSLKTSIEPGKFLAPHDFIDFTRLRKTTFYDYKTVHIDMSEPYCPHLRSFLVGGGEVIDGGVYVCTDGPRFETAAEVRMLKRLGGDVVGMTGAPEVMLARELEMCYASVCIVSNYTTSLAPEKLSVDEVFSVVERKRNDLVQLLYQAMLEIPLDRECTCTQALIGAEIDLDDL